MNTEEGGILMINDYSLLWGKIKQSGFTQSELAKKIGISKTSLSLKINNHQQFTQNEILRISNEIGIAKKDIPKYFFEGKVNKLNTNERA